MMKLDSSFLKYLRKYISTFKLKIKNYDYSIEFVNKPLGKNILVISPHFDDEVFGCGGTLAKHISSGDKVSVVYLTDSSNGIPSIKNKQLVNKIRKKESIEALKIIGIHKAYFISEIDGTPKIKRKTIKNMTKIFNIIKPDLVYLPWFLDNHGDHIKANFVLFEVCKNYGVNFNICAYEVWAPLVPNIIIDISDFYDIKMKASLCFKSQIKENNYINGIFGLNKYRTMFGLKHAKYAEGFLYLPAIEYLKLFKLSNVE